jgi:hypothetical protein
MHRKAAEAGKWNRNLREKGRARQRKKKYWAKDSGWQTKIQPQCLPARIVRRDFLAQDELHRCYFDVKDLKRLAALDRYERYALTKRRRPSQKLF